MVLPPLETFSAILTLEGHPQQGAGGITLLTLSDTEDSLHFLLLFRGLMESRSGGKWDGGRVCEEGGDSICLSEVSILVFCRTSSGSLAATDSTPGAAIARAPGQHLSPGS